MQKQCDRVEKSAVVQNEEGPRWTDMLLFTSTIVTVRFMCLRYLALLYIVFAS